MKTVNSFDVYLVKCSNCGDEFEGRMFRPSAWLGSAKYCDKCPSLKLNGDSGSPGPAKCDCGGSFESISPICPGCRGSIENSEKQIAAQFYLVQPAVDENNPTSEEIDIWYEAQLAEGFLSGKAFFIQLDRAVAFDENAKKWKTYERFEF